MMSLSRALYYAFIIPVIIGLTLGGLALSLVPMAAMFYTALSIHWILAVMSLPFGLGITLYLLNKGSNNYASDLRKILTPKNETIKNTDTIQ